MIDYSIIVIARGNHQYLKDSLWSSINQLYKVPVTLFYTTTKGELNEDILEYCVQNEIKIQYNNHDRGIFGNWNLALSVSNSRYVHLMHDDDVLREDFTSKIRTLIDKYPESAFYHSNAYLIDEKSKMIRPVNKELNSNYSGNEFFSCLIRNKNVNPICPSVVINMSRLETKKIFDERCSFAGDMLAWLKISADSTISFSEHHLISYRIHSKQTTQISGVLKKIKDRSLIAGYFISRSQNLFDVLFSFRFVAIALLRDILRR